MGAVAPIANVKLGGSALGLDYELPHPRILLELIDPLHDRCEVTAVKLSKDDFALVALHASKSFEDANLVVGLVLNRDKGVRIAQREDPFELRSENTSVVEDLYPWICGSRHCDDPDLVSSQVVDGASGHGATSPIQWPAASRAAQTTSSAVAASVGRRFLCCSPFWRRETPSPAARTSRFPPASSCNRRRSVSRR